MPQNQLAPTCLAHIRDWSDRWHNFLIAVFTLLLAFFSALLYCANRDYAATARAARRPWLGTFNVGESCNGQVAPYTLVANRKANLVVAYKNYGLSPALHAGAYQHAMIGSAPPAINTWTKNTPPELEDCWRKATALDVGPGFPSGESYYCNQEPEEDAASFSSLDVEDVKAGRKGFYLRGCFVYADDGGTVHHTDYCYFLNHDNGSAQGKLAFCPVGNSAD